MFGNVLGNCLYDKKYLADIKKIKVVPVSRPVRGFEIQNILITRLTS
jgi:recombination DNA repair RAD52 pathway protein